MSKLKYVVRVGDGMGDFPLPELGGRTPLEAAYTPAMDYIAEYGQMGQVQTIPQGFPPGSDVANLSLLGYCPKEVYSGRSSLEAASMGVDLKEGETAFRCNLVTLSNGPDGLSMQDYCGGHISTEEAAELIKELDCRLGNEMIKLYPGVSYRHLLVYRGDITGLATFPPHDYTGQNVDKLWAKYRAVPEIMEFMESGRAVLDDHPVNRKRQKAGKLPANGVWLWGEGTTPVMPTLREKYGISGTLISAVDLLKGIAVYAGLAAPDIDGATGYLDTNYEGKVSAALKALEKDDFVFLHVEAPDETGHQGVVADKIKAIEDFDRQVVKPVLEALKGGPDFRLIVCMDHLTPVSLKTHTSHPVAFALLDSRRQEKNSGLTYSEKNGESTGLRLADGEEFFRFLLQNSYSGG
ncbi:MAG: cofactor-independent phosphoglycerate mutase [Desulfobia sp.]